MTDEKKYPISFRLIWSMLAPMLVPRWPFFVSLAALAFLIAVLAVIEPYVYGRIVDLVIFSVSEGVNAADGFGRIAPFLFAWAGVVVVSTGILAAYSWISWYVGNNAERELTERSFRKFLTFSTRRFADERAGALLQRMTNGRDAIWRLLVEGFRTFLQSGAIFVVVVGVGAYLDWRLALAALAIIPIDVALGAWNLNLSLRKQETMNEKWEETTGIVGDTFANVASVQGVGAENRILVRFSAIFKKLIAEQVRLNVQWAVFDAGIGSVYIFGRLLVFLVGTRLVLSGETSLGTLVTFLGFTGAMYGAVSSMVGSLPSMATALGRLGRLASMFEEVPEVRDLPEANSAPAMRGDVEFDGVWFSYADADKPVLRGISVKVPAGKTFAVVGESGAGKSTLAKLLVRFADPTKGSVRFDGIDLRDMTLSTLRPQVGFVMQENLLFHETVLYNLRFAKPNATREEVVEAAKRAQAHEFIAKLPKGYDTVVGERGVKLSGGQKQRIALARVLLANPPILVLDEATSALDSKTEHDLQRALREVMRNRTTIVIAHRLSTVMDADNILVMDKGRVVDQGVHSELIRRDNLYKKFWEIQAGGYV
ncbi:hypothetical protein A2348_01820 [Candidatus Uhrbacteria bacterium RIFOXYB12_FULL_58_10]|uniref:ABC transporter ATP-binding protein n=1 Tax=Candidatus Uhrbacteria bacterium RIFOXYB2_FULL_57_15 TaxID=1802422 RepID=A0A1F7W6P0_9BACT|nr:MAG: hypothetical protein A2348_01820 [Candidatus Uhrbacteria bacterium RIFOXYB12_FULL_58_10]OGL97857.1 MAG: hypothetical protein A2304_04725 [Candidatus Uhrbacteria bacterium RIFOXYB2_FULL_57_15]OGM00466.1 MAG: hypothetical protein A2501_00690 [Candidatus Uhrbacteria bacterium RIFOXYC12_FULL_57_11]